MGEKGRRLTRGRVGERAEDNEALFSVMHEERLDADAGTVSVFSTGAWVGPEEESFVDGPKDPDLNELVVGVQVLAHTSRPPMKIIVGKCAKGIN